MTWMEISWLNTYSLNRNQEFSLAIYQLKQEGISKEEIAFFFEDGFVGYEILMPMKIQLMSLVRKDSRIFF